MKKRVLLGLVFSFITLGILLNLVSADIPAGPDPTHKDIPVVNNITNINNFPDYVFIAYRPNPACQPEVIGPEGIVPPGYSRCSVASVYAVNKSDFDENLIHQRSEALYDFFNSSKAIKVLSNIEVSRSVPVTDTESAIYNSYEINLSQAQVNPVKVDIERSYSFYYYLLIPIIALIIVIIILAGRRKNKKR